MMEYTSLAIEALSSDAQRALGAGPTKMMAARGMAPLANPVDLATVMYQLVLDADEAIATSARKSAAGLPSKILLTALADRAIDPRVLDYFANHAECRSDLSEVVVLNTNASDETIASLAAVTNAKIVDLISQNEERILRSPDIVAALYRNSKARMSTVDRVVELAVRQGMKVPGIPAWDELSRAVLAPASDSEPVLSAEEKDAMFAIAAPAEQDVDDTGDASEEEEETEIAIRDMTIPMKIRLAMVGNKFQRSQLIRDPKKIISMAVIKSPAVKEKEAESYASNNSLAEDVIGYIANKKEWTKQYQVKLALIANPKCPLSAAIRLLPHLRAKDLASIARSRNVPSAISAQAKKLNAVRTQKGKR